MKVDSDKDFADWDKHADYSDRYRPVNPVVDSDFEDRTNIRKPRLVDRGRRDCWNRDFLVAPGSVTGYSDRERSRRIGSVDFDRDHSFVESSLGKMDMPENRDSHLSFGIPAQDTRFVHTRLFVRRDWQ